MVKVVGIAFKPVGKIYWFNPHYLSINEGDYVVVETVRGVEIGLVVQGVMEVDNNKVKDLKSVLRLATKKDVEQYKKNIARKPEALEICQELIDKNKLPMKLLDAEYTLDNKKIIIYYTAEDRVDFRELLKDLASAFHLRIELRQVAIREGAKFIGGLGVCGRETCCTSHIREFSPVTMKMAKDQGMNLSANKVAGVCGKLMCCIGFESDFYQEQRKRIPGVGDIVKTPTCESCMVVDVDYLRELVTVKKDEDKLETFNASLVKSLKRKVEEVREEDLTDDIDD
jgi:cell fate regulator YaaT (PSP1 superfamily)